MVVQTARKWSVEGRTTRVSTVSNSSNVRVRDGYAILWFHTWETPRDRNHLSKSSSIRIFRTRILLDNNLVERLVDAEMRLIRI